MQEKKIKAAMVGPENETKKTVLLLFLWLEHHTEAFCGYSEQRRLTWWIR